MRTTKRNKTISKSTALREENPLPQFKVASYKCQMLRDPAFLWRPNNTASRGRGGREESVGYEV